MPAGALLRHGLTTLAKGRKLLQVLLGNVPDVVPQRLPLILLVPDVRPLERRDDVPHVLLE